MDVCLIDWLIRSPGLTRMVHIIWCIKVLVVAKTIEFDEALCSATTMYSLHNKPPPQSDPTPWWKTEV